MKKLFTLLALTTIFLTSCKQETTPNTDSKTETENSVQSLTESAWFYQSDFPTSNKGLITVGYFYDDAFPYYKNVAYLDTNSFQATFLSSMVSSINTDSRVLTADGTGNLHLRDVSTLGGTVSTPTALTAGSRVINTSTVSPTIYTVTVRSQYIFSGTATASITILGSVTATSYLETMASGTSTWIFRGNLVKVSSNLIGLTQGNGSSINVQFNPGDRYRFMTTTTSTGIGNGASYTFDGGSVQLIQ